jgi:hypothetical protein
MMPRSSARHPPTYFRFRISLNAEKPAQSQAAYEYPADAILPSWKVKSQQSLASEKRGVSRIITAQTTGRLPPLSKPVHATWGREICARRIFRRSVVSSILLATN